MEDKQQFNNDGMPTMPIEEGTAVPLHDFEPPRRRRLPWTKLAIFLIAIGVAVWGAGFVASGGRGTGGLYFSLADGFMAATIGSNEASGQFVPVENAHEITEIIVITSAISVVVEPANRGTGYGVQFINVDPVDMTFSNGVLTINTTSIERGFQIDVSFRGRREIRVRLPDQFEHVFVSSSSGSIRVIDTNAHYFSLTSRSGSIHMDDVNVGNTLIANTISGSIRFDDVSGDQFIVASTSGSIRGEELRFMLGEFETVSGSIDLGDVRWSNFSARSTSGSIRITEAVIDPAGDNTQLQSTSGTINLRVDGRPSDFSYTARTTTGSLNIDGSRVSGRNAEGGTGNHVISLQSTSGSVRLSFD